MEFKAVSIVPANKCIATDILNKNEYVKIIVDFNLTRLSWLVQLDMQWSVYLLKDHFDLSKLDQTCNIQGKCEERKVEYAGKDKRNSKSC